MNTRQAKKILTCKSRLCNNWFHVEKARARGFKNSLSLEMTREHYYSLRRIKVLMKIGK